MSIEVNPPPQIKLPRQLAQDRESSTYFRLLDRMLLQLWRRTGGKTDAINDSEQAITASSNRVSRNAARINALEIQSFTVENVTGDLTTSGNQILICNNSSPITITLDTGAIEGDSVHVKRKNAKVTVSGAIDGKTTKVINLKYYSMFLVFDGSEWAEI
jgi:hypothetical protein